MRQTIAISYEPFRRLKARQKPGESYSDVVLRALGRPRLTDFAGILSPESANRLRKTIEEDRTRRRRIDARRVSRR